VETLAERVARRYLQASSVKGPLEPLIEDLPTISKAIVVYSTVYGALFRQLTEMQAVLDSVPMGQMLKQLEKGLPKLEDLGARIKSLGPQLAALDRTFVDEVARASKEAEAHPDGEYEMPNWRSRVGPLLGETNKIMAALDIWYDWLPTESEVDDLNCMESRKLAVTLRQIGKLEGLESVGSINDLSDVLSTIDDYFKDAVDEYADL